MMTEISVLPLIPLFHAKDFSGKKVLTAETVRTYCFIQINTLT